MSNFSNASKKGISTWYGFTEYLQLDSYIARFITELLQAESDCRRQQRHGAKYFARCFMVNREKYMGEKWLEPFISAEENEKDKKSLERRLKEAAIGAFKPMSEFDWN